MVFSSYEFIFAFLPLVIVGYYLLSGLRSIAYQHLFLTGASLFFYGYFNITYLWIIIASIIVNYSIAKGIDYCTGNGTRSRRGLLVLGVLFNVGLLGYFKYHDFFVENINAVFACSFNLKYIILPLGISFFTFQQLSFLISIYKKEEKVETFLDYSLFVTFFPQLIAGPIVLYTEMIPQFKDPKRRYINWDNFANGLYVFAVGLFKKIVIADTVALFVDNGYGVADPGFVTAWVVALSYTMQIYFDFSGYCDMAIGIGKMFNINLPINFNSPYKSQSITEFWRRWHMTLGRALKTYVYIPLGGNRRGISRTYVNLFITFFVSGLWHGAAWTFVLWGVLHGVFIILERLAGGLFVAVPRYVKICTTFLVVNFLWVLFRAPDLETSLLFLKKMVSFGELDFNRVHLLANDGLIGFPSLAWNVYIFSILIVLSGIVFFYKEHDRDGQCV